MPEDRDPAAVRADAEALDWIVTLQEQPDDAGVRRRFELWRTASAANAVAWEKVAQVYAGIGETTPAHAERWRKLTADRQTSLAPPILAARRRRRMRGAVPRSEPRKGRRITAVALPAVAAAMLAIVAIPNAVLRWQADAVTGTAELRDVHLSDGSLASLGPDSAIGIDYSQGERRIRLLRGQAWFDVRHNADRPFRVVARGVEATDIGTAFEVRLDPSDTHVSVARGIVRVDYAKSVPPISARLVAGQSLAITTSGAATRDTTMPSLVGAWRDGRLAVQNQSMAEVIAALRPWYSGMIVVQSDTLAGHRVTGVYDLRDPAGAMTALASAYGGHVTRITPWLMILSDG